MKEVKFRFWSNLKHRYWDLKEQYLMVAHTGDVWLHRGSEMPVRILPDNVTIEQYTGLEDKNGVRIYEGDIVRWGKNCDLISEVNYSNKYACWFLGNYQLSNSLKFFISKCEVLGNVHENKELLEGNFDEKI
jgi:hypothetical protein